ncbi:MAG: type II 3-dehydroquinate dehydratase [Rhodothermales bacterium]|nr:type II 3-dehydroquinate dehydratase [Rhodothermales bacterium]
MKILVLNGPNLNLLGMREPTTYGSETLDSVFQGLQDAFPAVDLVHFQSNIEGELIDRLQAADADGFDGAVFNPGGYTHTSVAIRDAVASIRTPVVEVHISNIAAREEFRHNSLIAPVCAGQLSGFGTRGYHLAVRHFVDSLTK